MPQRILNACVFLAIAALVLHLCIFAVGNSDFWWHIKAGEIMRDTGGIIATDPFAYVREGQPYLASHEWLAQVILSWVFDTAGTTGIVVLRSALVLATALLLLIIDPRRIWATGFLVVLAAVAARPSIADRPQLWTLFLFTAALVLCLRYLDAPDQRRKRHILAALFGLQILWVNLHGAAAVMGLLIFGALLLEKLRTREKGEMRMLLCAGVLLSLALLLSPIGAGNVTYLWSLLTDRTADLIAEWQPTRWRLYVNHFWLLWTLGIVSLAASRRHLVLFGTLLLVLGVLSRSAGRHEMLLGVTLAAVALYELRHSDHFRTILDAVFRRAFLAPVVIAALILLLTWWYSSREAYDILRRDHLFGIGAFEPMRGAYEFLEREKVTGPGFNSYEAGGELLYRGYPDRKVFIDGRNVDYGAEFMAKAIEASSDAAIWDSLSRKYGFTHAIVALYPYLHENGNPYTMHLELNPEWALVYVDDWAAVYAKDIPENRDVIARSAYRFVTPLSLYRLSVPEEISVANLKKFEGELLRIRGESPRGIRAAATLARLYASLGFFPRAEELLGEARAIEPNRFETLLLTSDVYAAEDRFPEAAAYLDRAIDAMGHTGVVVDWSYAADLHEKAGNDFRSRWYRLRAQWAG